MAVTFQAAQEKARFFVREDAKRLNPNDWTNVQALTRKRFNRDKPRVFVEDVAGDGSFDYTLPANFDPDYSSIQRIEYPSGNQKPTILDRGSYTIYDDGTEKKLRFLDTSPATGETIRVTFTRPHEFDEETSSIPDEEEDLFSTLMAHFAARAVQADFMKDIQTNLAADSADFSTKVDQYKELAKDLLSDYIDLLKGGSGEESTEFFTFSKDFDIEPDWEGDYLIHRKENR